MERNSLWNDAMQNLLGQDCLNYSWIQYEYSSGATSLSHFFPKQGIKCLAALHDHCNWKSDITIAHLPQEPQELLVHPIVSALNACPVKQTVMVSCPRWLKGIKEARFIGEAVFSVTSCFCTAAWLEGWDIRGNKFSFQFLGSSFTRGEQAAGTECN